MQDHELEGDGHQLRGTEHEKLGRDLRAALEDAEQTRKRLSWVGRLVLHKRFDDALALIDAASASLRTLRRAVLAVQSSSVSSRPASRTPRPGLL